MKRLNQTASKRGWSGEIKRKVTQSCNWREHFGGGYVSDSSMWVFIAQRVRKRKNGENNAEKSCSEVGVTPPLLFVWERKGKLEDIMKSFLAKAAGLVSVWFFTETEPRGAPRFSEHWESGSRMGVQKGAWTLSFTVGKCQCCLAKNCSQAKGFRMGDLCQCSVILQRQWKLQEAGDTWMSSIR